MTDALKKLACCLLLLALTGTVSGAEYYAAEHAGVVSHNENAVPATCGLPGKTQNPCLICKDSVHDKCRGLEFWPGVWCGIIENMKCNVLCFT